MWGSARRRGDVIARGTWPADASLHNNNALNARDGAAHDNGIPNKQKKDENTTHIRTPTVSSKQGNTKCQHTPCI
jgi:hypothetical protein